MSERALRQLVGALAVVVILGAVGMLLRSGSGGIGATGEAQRVFDGLDASTVDEVRIEAPGSETVLSRGEGGWTVSGYPADVEAVARMLSTVSGLSVGDLVAANPANHDRMGVSADSALTVTFIAGDLSRTILLGKSGRRFGTAYFRLPGQDRVWLLEGDLRAALVRDLDAWRDRVIVSLDTTSVARLVVERDGDGYALERGDSVWTFAGGGAVESGAVVGILTELARLTATGFLAEGDSIAAAPQAAATTAISAEGVVLAEVRFGDGTGDRWARSSESEWLYRVSSFRANRVAPEREAVTPGG